MTRLRLEPGGPRPLGYHGRILHVDLGHGRLWAESPSQDFYRRYCGGGLLGTRLLLDLTAPGVDPLSPESILVVTSSVVAGHRAVALPRFSVVAKSPLSGGIGEARGEGPWGVALKESGVDAIVVRGRSAQPCYLLLQAGEAQLRDGTDLWGGDTGATTDILCDRHGQDAQVAAIGVAGERAVRYASIVTCRTFPAPRMGLGAVMGAKRLKAIVLSGGRGPEVADASGLKALTDAYAARIPGNPLSSWQHDPPGFGAWPAGAGLAGYLGVENYRTSRLPDPSPLRPEAFTERMVWDGGCPGCPNLCIKGFAAGTGDRRAGGLHQEAVAALGPNLGIWDLDAILGHNTRCHLWGVDPVSLGFSISFVFELAARGLAPGGVGGAVGGGFGDTTAAHRLAEEIVHRRGPVAWLADGVARAARRLGPSTAPYALHVKGVEMVSFDPRASAGQALAYAVSPLGPRYDIVEHDIDFDPIDGKRLYVEQAQTLGVAGFMPMAALSQEKVAATRTLMEFWSGLDALDICPFAAPPTRPLTVGEVAGLVQAVTGWDISDEDVRLWGRRRLHLMRVYNLREGLRAADDRLPDRFFDEPIDSGRHAGVALDRERFEAARRHYYQLMGWDQTGAPLPATLAADGLT